MKLYQHPEYVQNIKDYIRFRDFVEANQDTMRALYLIPFEHEKLSVQGKDKLSGRLQRTFYTNYTRRIILAWLAFLFKNTPDLTKIERIITKEQQADIDGTNRSLENWIKFEVAFTYLQYGKVYVLTDAPAVGTKTRPIVTAINPIDVPDWELSDIENDQVNKFKWIDWQYSRLRKRQSSAEAPKQDLIRKRFFLTDGRVLVETWIATQKEGQLYDPRSLNYELSYNWDKESETQLDARFDEIPISVAGCGSFIKDVVPESQREYNLSSSEENILHATGYQKHIGIGKFSQSDPKIWSESTILLMDEGSNFITIPAGDAEGIRKRRIEVRDNIFTLGLNQFDKLPSDSRAAQSDKTKRQELENTVDLARTVTSEIESLMNNVVKHWALFVGQKPPSEDEHITLSTDFDTDDIEALLNIYSTTRDDLSKLPTTLKQALKKIYSFYEFDQTRRKEIDEEIETAQFGAAAQPDIKSKLLTSLVQNGGQVQTTNQAGSPANGQGNR